MAHRVNHEATERVGDQNIPPPQQVGMRQAEHQQPTCAAIVKRRRAAEALFGAVAKQTDPRAKQHREQRDELQIGQHVAANPGGQVDTLKAPPCRRVDVGGTRHGEVLNVHQENPKQSKAAQHIEAAEALAGRRGVGFVRLRRGLVAIRFDAPSGTNPPTVRQAGRSPCSSGSLSRIVGKSRTR